MLFLVCSQPAFADRLLMNDGTVIEADEAWDDPQGVWYRQGGVSYFVERARVKTIERASRAAAKGVEPAGREAAPARVPSALIMGASFVADAAGPAQSGGGAQPITIHLVDGASFEADEASESADGVWYRRGALSIFIDRARIARVERGVPASDDGAGARVAARRERRWTTGSVRLDGLIRQNGARHGVDPYLIFLVMEQESHFNSRAVSPAGARGLMQLMPGTAARFGVRNALDPAQSVAGGTRYLRQLLGRFNNRVDLALASYNAGEGNVLKYGYRVPPFRETRNYVRKIGGRYGSLAHVKANDGREPGAGAEKRPE